MAGDNLLVILLASLLIDSFSCVENSNQLVMHKCTKFPGTKWCGRNCNGSNYDDLGLYQEEDKCCRTLFYCTPKLNPGECLGKLCNLDDCIFYSCHCMNNLKKCLSNINRHISQSVSNLYMKTVAKVCFINFQNVSPTELE